MTWAQGSVSERVKSQLSVTKQVCMKKTISFCSSVSEAILSYMSASLYCLFSSKSFSRILGCSVIRFVSAQIDNLRTPMLSKQSSFEQRTSVTPRLKRDQIQPSLPKLKLMRIIIASSLADMSLLHGSSSQILPPTWSLYCWGEVDSSEPDWESNSFSGVSIILISLSITPDSIKIATYVQK